MISLERREGRPLRIGHRGAAALAPENTLQSFRAAIEIGVDLIEFDVLDLRDGQLVIAHSNDLAEVSHGAARGTVRDRSLENLRETCPEVPTLDEGLEFFVDEASEIGLHLDLKIRGTEGEVVEALRRFDLLERSFVSSFHFRTVRRVAEIEPRLRAGITVPRSVLGITEGGRGAPIARAALALARGIAPIAAPLILAASHSTALVLHHSLVGKTAVRRAHDRGASVVTWTVDDPRDLVRVGAAGVDAVVTNDPPHFRVYTGNVRTSARAIGAGLLAACALVGFASAFAIASSAGADTGTTITTDPPPTTEPPPTEPPIEPPPPPTPAPIAFGVTIGGVSVGGLMPQRASHVVQKAFSRPLVLVVSPTRKIQVRASTLQARPNVPKAVGRARVARPGASVALDVEVSRARVRSYVDRLGRDLDVKPVDARIALDGVKPRAIESQEGRRLERVASSRAVRYALQRNTRAPIRLGFDTLKPKVASVDLGTAVVILRGSNRLLYFVDAKFVRWFGVATGLPAYPTPLGTYEIVNMRRDPWWYPPPSPWAADSEPVPPGPGNPLGTRWMGISSPYVGIHGTPDAASIGYSASHGCIRMRIPDAEWLFQRMELGTPVFIVAR